MGNTDTNVESTPTIIPGLQNISVISVVLGDYHFGALTANGKLLTWGEYSKGALGLGDPVDIEPGQPGGFPTKEHRQMALSHRRGQAARVNVPTEVRFDHSEKKRKDMFCFAAAAAGWHMGALVIDLETNTEDGDASDESGPHMPGHLDPSTPSSSQSFPEPHGPHLGVRPPGLFRIGFAGRGMQRGGFGSNMG
jgi:SCF-associated factor 1